VRELRYGVAVIGGGAAGMAAATAVRKTGGTCAVIEREEGLGGVLPQCIHNGFGLIDYDEELTGPEFARRLADACRDSGADALLSTTVLSIRREDEGIILLCASSVGMLRIRASAAVLAMGCRERNRGNVRIAGSRPAGVFTAGLAQRLLNIDGYLPGKEAVIIGSGDIGLIMARRLAWSGCPVRAVVEIQDRPSGLPRNVAQCLDDQGIPLLLSRATTRIIGRDRVAGVETAPLLNGAPDASKASIIPCDTVLLSVGLVPENELSREAGIDLNPMTGGPWTDARLMTSLPGVFACGNVHHVHDLADFAAEEARRAGNFAARWAGGERHAPGIALKAGSNIRYSAPSRIEPGRINTVYARSLIWADDAVLELRSGDRVITSQKRRFLRPPEMISLDIDPEKLPEGMTELEIAIRAGDGP
jgi:NADPH-dependent 2,4-dienoyl-CoA reductase/sulfur reductase-like enzyme